MKTKVTLDSRGLFSERQKIKGLGTEETQTFLQNSILKVKKN